MYCKVLHCAVLYSTVLNCNVIHCTFRAALYSTLVYTTILYITAVYCAVFFNVLYFTVLNSSKLYWTLLFSTALYCSALYCTVLYCTIPFFIFCTVLYCSGVPRGVWGVQTPPSTPNFQSSDKAKSNSQFRGKYIRNNLTRIRLSLIFWVVSWKGLPANYHPQQWYLIFLSKLWRYVSVVTEVWISVIRIP
jgi:hypothetical protein